MVTRVPKPPRCARRSTPCRDTDSVRHWRCPYRRSNRRRRCRRPGGSACFRRGVQRPGVGRATRDARPRATPILGCIPSPASPASTHRGEVADNGGAIVVRPPRIDHHPAPVPTERAMFCDRLSPKFAVTGCEPQCPANEALWASRTDSSRSSVHGASAQVLGHHDLGDRAAPSPSGRTMSWNHRIAT